MEWLYCYDTLKTVRIQDRWLGLIYYSLLGSIFAYTVLYVVFFQKGYIEYETPVGAVKIKLRQDLNEGQLNSPYCYGGKDGEVMCEIWDNTEIVSQQQGDGVLMLATHVKEYVEERICPPTAHSCPEIWHKLNERIFYIANIENIQLDIYHSMQAPQFFDESGHNKAYGEANRQMAGVLIVGHKVIRSFPIGQTDLLTLQNLLHAAQIDLSDISMANMDSNRTLRETGLILHINIAYNNVRCDMKLDCAFGTIPITYRYRVYHVPDAQYDIEAIHELNDTVRIRRVKSGILLKFIQTGKIGRFSMQVLVINICSGLGMMAIATVIVDSLALYVLPKRGVYFQHKYKVVDSKQKKSNEQTSLTVSSGLRKRREWVWVWDA